MNKQIQAQQALKAALLQAQALIRQMALKNQGERSQQVTVEHRGDVRFEVLTYRSADIRVSLKLSRWANASWWALEVYDARDLETTGAPVELASGSDKDDWGAARECLQDTYDMLA